MKIRRTLTCALFLACGVCLCHSQSALSVSHSVEASPQAGPAAPQFGERNPRYSLRPGDVLELSFELSPELNQQISVQPDGYVTLKQIGDFHVAGQSVPEFTQAVKAAYSKFLHDPIITVSLKDFEKPFFTAGGMVAHPGKYEMRGDVTLVEALQQAGGFTEESKHSQVLLFRRVSQDWAQAKVIDVKKMLKEKTLAEDIHLQSGDMIFVPQNRVSKIRKFIPTAGLSMYSPIP
ncbi:MAG TPA: polysaccharide biosynthesis/export family protein [Terriglobales bacterium]|nr:polysaccharide biosynthesis/export family protein [Terriglobales bacterium]